MLLCVTPKGTCFQLFCIERHGELGKYIDILRSNKQIDIIRSVCDI